LRERLLAGERRQEHGLVFTTTIGTPIDGRKINGYFKSILARAGLSPKRFHDLRHTCASLLLAQGVHPRVVMDILGHSTIGLTMNSYSHVIPALQQEAVGLTRALLKERT
ncbi:MAG: tyrosine-type recombinase/integrase, partial [Rhodothalassiaceae bacterium]